MKTPEQAREFLDSLDGEKGLPDKFYRLLIPGVDVWREGDEILGAKYIDMNEPAWIAVIPSKIGSLIASNLPCRRAESRQIPDLKERVKELVRHAMDVAYRQAIDDNSPQISIGADEYKSIRALCAPLR